MWHGQDETIQGVGCPGGCQGADTPRYQWVQGVDGLGNHVGYWQPTGPLATNAPYARRSAPFFGEVAEAADGQLYQWVEGVDGLGSPFGFWKRLKRLAKRAMPLAQKLAPFIPGGAAALTVATPFLKRAGMAGLGDVGALYAADDGTVYQLHGIDADEGVDGLADDELQGLADDDLQGLEDDELQGLEADEELNGFSADAAIEGLADGDDLQGLSADPDLDGYASADPLEGLSADDLEGFADDDLQGFADDDLQGFADDPLEGIADDGQAINGYVRDGRLHGIDGYERERPPRTPAFAPAANAPMWAPLW
ncbi:MAG: hypothetical protein IT178_09890 [Acidobacteria bacterium]|nr:hypothetical protein [Acidobacteriota bacterium]